MKKITFTLFFLFCLSLFSVAKEGMWLPVLLQFLNEKDMKTMGMKISADDIYSINHASLKDAIVIFGGGCTGEVVSNNGLLLTNYHCGYGNIQRHSAIDHDYLTDGFWAKDKSEELSCPGLTVSLLIEMRDVTAQVNSVLKNNMTQAERDSVINNISQQIVDNAISNTHYKGDVESYFCDNQFYLIIYEVFNDIRLVGAPPSNIGKFGGDTDNWVWPRHTGDFSIFRIYADKDNNPADYSQDNKPYQPKQFLKISLDGVNQDDFTFVFGYPGHTDEYITSGAVYNMTEVDNPIAIDIRNTKLTVMKKYSEQSPAVRIKYANKIAGIANGWKKWIGQTQGVEHADGIHSKRIYEQKFQEWAKSTRNNYTILVPELNRIYQNNIPYEKSTIYIREAGLGVEIVKFAGNFSELILASKHNSADLKDIYKLKKSLANAANLFYKDYYMPIDKELCPQLLKTVYDNIDKDLMPDIFKKIEKKYKGNFKAYSNYLFDNTILNNSKKFHDFIENYKQSDYNKLEKDPAYILFISLVNTYKNNIIPYIDKNQNSIDSLMRLYMKAQMEFEKEKTFYPDANFTLRVAYGKVEGFNSQDAVEFNYFTTLDGIMEKENPDIYDYVVENKLKDLYNKKDYGRYGDKDGKMHVCFIASNHTSGGNSGSPVLNADGNLIGLNFDRNWQGTMSDIIYNPDICRNIVVDIRYVLFIIDKFAGAQNIINEMTIATSNNINTQNSNQ